MATLKGKKGIDKGVIVHVHDRDVESWTASGDYEVVEIEAAEKQQDDGVLQEVESNRDYSVPGRREAGLARE